MPFPKPITIDPPGTRDPKGAGEGGRRVQHTTHKINTGGGDGSPQENQDQDICYQGKGGKGEWMLGSKNNRCPLQRIKIKALSRSKD